MPRRQVTRALKAPDEAPSSLEQLDLGLIEGIVAAVPNPESGLIGILQKVQNVYGYLPEAVVKRVSRLTGVPASRIYGVITFYAQFSTVPIGRHKVCVCQGTACHVRGGHGVLHAVESKLGLKPGETDDDLVFTLETVTCLGACSLAPVLTVDGRYYGKLTGSRVLAALDAVSGEHGGGDGSAGSGENNDEDGGADGGEDRGGGRR